MNNLNHWEQTLRKSLADHATPPPADGWAALEHDLTVAARRRRRYLGAALGAAVTVAAAVLAVVFVPPAGDGSAPLLHAPAGTERGVVAATTGGADGSAKSRPAGPVVTAAAEQPRTAVGAETVAAAEPTPMLAAALAAETDAPVAAAAVADTVTEDVAEHDAERGGRVEVMAAGRARSAAAARHLMARAGDGGKSPRRGATLSVSMGGTPATDVRQGGYAFLPQSGSLSAQSADWDYGDRYAAILKENVVDVVSSTASHRLPVRLSMNVSFPLTGRLSLETGLTYTYLRTDLTSGSEDYYYATAQRLHYVGIPLRLSYTFYRSRTVDVYATGGGSVAKCVSGDWRTDYVVAGTPRGETERTDVGAGLWQATLDVAAGIQVNAGRRWGLFVEPGMTYYVPDGSNLPGVYHDHPFNFSLNAGLRFRLK